MNMANLGPQSMAFRSVWLDICDTTEEAAAMEARSSLLCDLQSWAKRMSPNKAARQLGMTAARVRELRSGQFSKFTLGELKELTARAGRPPE